MRRCAFRPLCFALLLLTACGRPFAVDETISPGAWTAAPPLPEQRFEAYAATDGERIYLLGGIVGDNVEPLRSARPSNRVSILARGAATWIDGPPLPDESAKHHLTVAVVDREIYVLGGFDGILGRTAGEEFVPRGTTFVLRDGAWRRLADSPLPRGGATAQAIGGKIYVVGGARTELVDPYSENYEYDPKTNVWTQRASLPTAREHLASCAFEGKMLVVGGWIGALRPAQGIAELYDPKIDAWTRLPNMPTRRGGLGATMLGKRCFVVGGEDWELPPPGTFPANEAWDFETSTWRDFAPMPAALHGIGVVAFDDEIWVVGGGPIQGNSYTNAVSVFQR